LERLTGKRRKIEKEQQNLSEGTENKGPGPEECLEAYNKDLEEVLEERELKFKTEKQEGEQFEERPSMPIPESMSDETLVEKDTGKDSEGEEHSKELEGSNKDGDEKFDDNGSWESSVIREIEKGLHEIMENPNGDWGSYTKIIVNILARTITLASSEYYGKKGQDMLKGDLQGNEKFDWKTEKMKFVLASFRKKVEGDVTGKETNTNNNGVKSWEKEFKNPAFKKYLDGAVVAIVQKRLGMNMDEVRNKLPKTLVNNFPFYDQEGYKLAMAKPDVNDPTLIREIRDLLRKTMGPNCLMALHTIFGVFDDKEELKFRLKDLAVMQTLLKKTGEHGTYAPMQWENICFKMNQHWSLVTSFEHHPGMLNRTQVYQWTHAMLILIHDHFPRDTWVELKLNKILGIAMVPNHRNEELLSAIHTLVPKYLTLPDHIGHNMVENRHDAHQMESETFQQWKTQPVVKHSKMAYNELSMAKDIWPVQAWVADCGGKVQSDDRGNNYSYHTKGRKYHHW